MKKFLSVLITITMLVGISAPVFAAEKKDDETFSYVALGDSSSDGYGLSGFDFSKSGRYSYVPEAYIWRFADLLRESGKDVSFTNLTLCGMRPNELVYFLDPSVEYDELDAYAKQWYRTFTVKAYPDRQTLTDTYCDAIRGADLITYDLGTNNFGNYMVARLAGIFGVEIGFDWEGYNDEHLDELMPKLNIPISNELKNRVTDIIGMATEGVLPKGILTQLTDTMLFSYFNFVIGFRDSMDAIYELNDEAEIIVFGLANTMRGTVVRLGGVTVDLGILYGSMIDLANEYIISLNKHCCRYKYADLKAGVENVVEALAAGKVYDDLADDLLDLFYSGDMLGDEAGAFVGKLAYGTDGVQIDKETAKAAYRSEEATPEKTAAEHIINTFMKAAGYSDPLDIVAGLPYVQNGMSGLSVVFAEAFTDYDNSSELAKGATKLILNLLENGTGAHPSVYGHEQKLNALTAAYEGKLTANGTHIKRFVPGTVSFVSTVFSSPDWLATLKTLIRSFVASLLPIKLY